MLVLSAQTVFLKSPDQPCMGTFIHTFCPWTQDLHLNLGLGTQFWPDFCGEYAISSFLSGPPSLVDPGELAALWHVSITG